MDGNNLRKKMVTRKRRRWKKLEGKKMKSRFFQIVF